MDSMPILETMSSLLSRIEIASNNNHRCRTIEYSGAGSGMACMAAAIPIWNLVWRLHTNLRKSAVSWFSGKSLKLLPPDVRFEG